MELIVIVHEMREMKGIANGLPQGKVGSADFKTSAPYSVIC
jgi:hypothetical protein